uniref:Uncharacterized protein n=1 Tax=Cucumis melo TaxID=3656 RepID=A0A9I9DMJ1_CUCME
MKVSVFSIRQSTTREFSFIGISNTTNFIHDGGEPLDATETVLLEVAEKGRVGGGGWGEHGLKVGEGGVFDERVFDGEFVEGGGGGGGGRRRGVGEEVFEAGVGLKRGHFDVVREL